MKASRARWRGVAGRLALGRVSAPEAAGCDACIHAARLSRYHECCANDCVFMAVKLLQVLVLGVIAAAAVDGAFV